MDAQYPGLLEYCENRAAGMRPTDAAREAGVNASRQPKYERYYRNVNDLPKGNVGPRTDITKFPRIQGVFNG